MKGYELSRRWFDFAFRSPESRTPSHAALYFWYIEWANRCSWPDVFEMAPQYAMTAIGVSSYNTYDKVFNDLCDWGFVRLVRKGKNQYTPCLLALSKIDEPINEPRDKTAPKTKRALSKNDKAQDTADDDASSKNDKPLDRASPDALSKNDKPREIITKEDEQNEPKTILLAESSAGEKKGESGLGEKKGEQAPPPTPAPLPPGKVYGDGVLQAKMLAYYRDNPDQFPLAYLPKFLYYWTGKDNRGDPQKTSWERWRKMNNWETEDRLNRWHEREHKANSNHDSQRTQTDFLNRQRAAEPQSIDDYGEF